MRYVAIWEVEVKIERDSKTELEKTGKCRYRNREGLERGGAVTTRHGEFEAEIL